MRLKVYECTNGSKYPLPPKEADLKKKSSRVIITSTKKSLKITYFPSTKNTLKMTYCPSTKI